MSFGGRPPARGVPGGAGRLSLLLWDRSQARLRRLYGFDLNSPDVVERVRSLIAGKPDDPDLALLLAAAISTRGDDDQALAEARRAVSLAPGSARAHTTLATLLVRRGEMEAGLVHARRAVEAEATDPHALYNLGLAEFAAGDKATGRDAFRRAAIALGVAPEGSSGWRRWLSRWGRSPRG